LVGGGGAGIAWNTTASVLWACADVNLLGYDINSIKKYTALPDNKRKISVEVNTETTASMFMLRHQEAGRNHNNEQV
jgi:hypothetical protein